MRAEKSERFGHKWFKPVRITDREVRESTRKKYVEPFAKTDRKRNNPIDFLTRKLNTHYAA